MKALKVIVQSPTSASMLVCQIVCSIGWVLFPSIPFRIFFIHSTYEWCVHINVLAYVDDLLISENNHGAMQQFKEYLSASFHMKDLGVLKYFLGIEVTRSDGLSASARVVK